MLEVQHITKIYNPGTVHETCLFKDFSLKIEQGLLCVGGGQQRLGQDQSA